MRERRDQRAVGPSGVGYAGALADATSGQSGNGELQRSRQRGLQPEVRGGSYAQTLDHAASARRDGEVEGAEGNSRDETRLRMSCERCGTGVLEHPESEQARVSRCARERRATGGFWADADWLPCRGGKWRAVEPGTFPLAHGAPQRMGRLRAYGNAIVLPAAQAFIEAAMSVLP